MIKVKIFDFYSPIMSVVPIEPIYLGEFYGLDTESAKKQYEQLLADGFYDD